MSMSEFFWSDVDSDAAREQHEAQVERARVAVAGAWPFLSEATSRNDYLNRLSLVEDRIHNAVASATSTDAEFASVLGALHASLDEDWYTLREARVREARVKRARAKRAAQRKHAGGWAVYDGMANDRRLTPPVGTREEAEQARIEYLDQNPEADPSWVYVGTTFFGEATRKRAQGDEIEPDEPTGQGAADVDDVPTPGQEVADYPQPEGEGEPGSTPDGEGEWANEDGEAREARLKTAVSLSNVGIDPETGNGVGTDPSGQRVQFHLSESDRQQLKSVLLSDLAVNFSGVDVAESDIIRQSRRRAGGARGRGSAGLSLAQVRTAAEQYAILMPSDNNSLATHDGMTKQQAEELLRTYDFGPGAKVVTLEEAERLQGQARKQGGYYDIDNPKPDTPPDEVCALCKSRPAVDWVQPFGNRNYSWLPLCQECIDSGAIYATSRKVAWSIDDVRRVVRNWQYETVDGMMLDATSAYLLMQVYDAIDEGHKQRLSDQPLDVAVDMAAKVLNRAAKKAGRKVPSVVARRLTKNAISVNLVTGNGEVLIRAPGESASSIKRMLRSSNIDAQVIDNGDDTFEVSVAKSRTQDAAQILRNATRTAALSAGDRVEVISDTESQDGSTTIPAGSVLTINEVEDQGDPDARGGLLHTTFNGNPVYLSEGDVRKSSSRTAETHAPYRIQESNGQYKVVNDNGETKGTHDTWEQAREQQKALYRNVPGAPEQAERKSESSRRVAFDDGHRLGQPNPPYHVEDLDPSGTAHTVVCDVPGCDWSDTLTNVAPNFLWSDHARQVRNQAVDMLHDLSTARKVEVEQIGPRQFLWAVSDDERLYGSGIAPTRSLARREAAQHLGDNSRGNNPYTPVGESNPFGEQGNPYDLTGEDVTDQGPLAEDMAGPVSIEGPPQTTRPRGGGEQDGAPADPSSPEGPQPVGEAAAGRNRR